MKGIKFLIASLFVLLSQQAAAFDGIAASIGDGNGTDQTIYRASLRWDWDARWFALGPISFGGLWELSYQFLEDTDNDDHDGSPHVVSFAPVFRLKADEPLFWSMAPFVEAGIGVSLFTETRADNRSLSTMFQFEDRIGAGVRLGENGHWEIKGNIIHFSNAGIKKPNNGVNIKLLTLGFWF